MAASLKFRGSNSLDKKRFKISENEELSSSSFCYYSFPRPLWYVVISLVGFCCFWNSLQCDLVHDDIFAIKENADMRQDASLSQIFSNDFWGNRMSSNTSHKSYRPLCILTFRLNYVVHGLDPFGYHLMNVFIHVIVSLMFVFVCETVVVKSLTTSVVAGLLFVSHPIHTEAVTGVVGRADILACLLFLLSFLMFVRCTKCKSQFKASVCLACCAVLGSMAMLIKEHGITVFGVCAVYDVFIVSRESILRLYYEHNIVAAVKEAKHTIMRVLLLVAVVLCLLVFRIWMLGGNLPHFGIQDNPASFADSLLTRMMTYSYLAAFNCWLLLSPNVLCYDWQIGSIPLVETGCDVRNVATFAFYFALVLLVRCCILFKTQASHQCLLGLAFLVIPFLPASNLFFRVGFVVAERILYIPSMGFCVLVALGFNKLVTIATRTSAIGHSKLLVLLMFGMLVLILLFCLKTMDRNYVWKDRESLFRSGVETLPHNAKVHYNFANFLKDVERKEEAIQHYRTALQLTPDHVSAHNNLGTLLANDQEAIEHFSLAIKFDPNHANSYFNLGSRYGVKKKFEEAERMLREAVRLNPRYADAMLSLAGVLSEMQKISEAEEFYKRALVLSPDHVDVINNYGVFLANIGRHEEALENYKRALQVNENSTVVLVNMGRLLRTVGRTPDAEVLYKRALAVKREPNTLHLLGALYFNTERLSDAASVWQEALKIDPLREQTRSNYAILLSRTSHHSDAVNILTKLVEENPQKVEHLIALSNVYAQAGKISESLRVVKDALKIQEDAELYFTQGNLLKDLKKMDEARKSFEKAVQMDSAHASAHMNLGVLFHLQKQYRLARKHYEAALAWDPDNTILRQNLQKLSRIEGQSQS